MALPGLVGSPRSGITLSNRKTHIDFLRERLEALGDMSAMTNINTLVQHERSRRQALVEGYIVPDPARCVQCGICSYNCPININVRRHAWLGEPVKDSNCLTCGQCVQRCPRGVLRFEKTNLFQSRE